ALRAERPAGRARAALADRPRAPGGRTTPGLAGRDGAPPPWRRLPGPACLLGVPAHLRGRRLPLRLRRHARVEGDRDAEAGLTRRASLLALLVLVAGCGGSPSPRHEVAASCKRQQAALAAIGRVESLPQAKRALHRTIDVERRGGAGAPPRRAPARGAGAA